MKGYIMNQKGPRGNLRKAKHKRISKETQIISELNIDGEGNSQIKTPIGLIDHMLELFAFHGFFDLKLEVKKADTNIDIHHTNEDIGIVLGKVFNEALGKQRFGIKRFGSAFAPMESTLGHSVVDLSGRGHFYINVEGLTPQSAEDDNYSFKALEHFLESFAKNLGANIIVRVYNPMNSTADLHTVMETVFKSLGIALDQATQIDHRRGRKVPSTKGIID